jgi:hypothetical protein
MIQNFQRCKKHKNLQGRLFSKELAQHILAYFSVFAQAAQRLAQLVEK